MAADARPAGVAGRRKIPIAKDLHRWNACPIWSEDRIHHGMVRYRISGSLSHRWEMFQPAGTDRSQL